MDRTEVRLMKRCTLARRRYLAAVKAGKKPSELIRLQAALSDRQWALQLYRAGLGKGR
jgi:hypothetical protein